MAVTRRKLSTGVQVYCVPVDWQLLSEAIQSVGPPPQPPMILTDAGHQEPNRSSKKYRDAHAAWESRRTDAFSDALWRHGIVVDYVPDNVDAPASDQWRAELKLAGVRVGPNWDAEWLRLVACQTDDDMALLHRAVIRETVTLEEDVAAAAAMFRHRTQRRAYRNASGSYRDPIRGSVRAMDRWCGSAVRGTRDGARVAVGAIRVAVAPGMGPRAVRGAVSVRAASRLA